MDKEDPEPSANEEKGGDMGVGVKRTGAWHSCFRRGTVWPAMVHQD